jgi:hypothetical protein
LKNGKRGKISTPIRPGCPPYFEFALSVEIPFSGSRLEVTFLSSFLAYSEYCISRQTFRGKSFVKKTYFSVWGFPPTLLFLFVQTSRAWTLFP